LALCERETELGAQAKSAQEALMERVLAQYGKLTDDDIRTLVVEDKWLASLSTAVQGELDRVSQTLTGPHPRAGGTLRETLAGTGVGRGGVIGEGGSASQTDGVYGMIEPSSRGMF
jgi:hypothetical protein